MFKDYYLKIRSFITRPAELGRGVSLGVSANRDWKILCAAFLFFVVVIILADYLILYGGAVLEFTPNIGTDSVTMLDEVKLVKVMGEWRVKEDKFNNIFEMPPVVVDPSL